MNTTDKIHIKLSLPIDLINLPDGPEIFFGEDPDDKGSCSIIPPHSDENLCYEFGLNRARKWMLESPCAIVTAWRKGDSRLIKNIHNKQLMRELLNKGYGVVKVRGYYAEVGEDINKENSFFVFTRRDNPNLPLKDDVYSLSIRFKQDSFVFKEPGVNSHAFLIGTNSDFGMGKIVDIGTLHFNMMSANEYTAIGSGQISFQ